MVALSGGGPHLDIIGEQFLYQIAGNACPSLFDQFITIAPSYRGNMLKIGYHCLISDGSESDAFYGAAIDAIALLEAVKEMYNKSDSTRVLGFGVSRGATVSLMIGGLTNKFDYIIAASSFSTFLDPQMVEEGRISGPFVKALYSDNITPESFRKRAIASSPIYFTDHLPPFELHQGGKGKSFEARHGKQLLEQIKKSGKPEQQHHVYLYESKGHNYFDKNKVCNSIKIFLVNKE
jgi:hypothetical protein